MSIIRSNHNSSSPESIENRKFNENLVNELREKISVIENEEGLVKEEYWR